MLSDCVKCWETPCVCGHDYKDRPLNWLSDQCDMLNGVLIAKADEVSLENKQLLVTINELRSENEQLRAQVASYSEEIKQLKRDVSYWQSESTPGKMGFGSD